MKIKSKLKLSFLLSGFLLLLTGIAGIMYLVRVGHLSDNIYNRNLIPIDTIAEIDSLINRELISISLHVMAEDLKEFKVIENESEQRFNSINKKIDFLANDEENIHEIISPLGKIKDSIAVFREKTGDIHELSRKFIKEDAMKRLHILTKTTFLELKNTCDEVSLILNNNASKYFKTVRSNISTFTVTTIIVIVAGLLLMGSIGFITYTSITTPISKAVTYFGMLASGNTRNRLGGDETQDEMGELARAFNKIVDVIESMTSEVKILTNAAMDGRLDIRGNAAGFEGHYANIIKGLNDTLDAIISPLNVSAEYIDRISKGDIPEKNSAIYRGDFQKINNSIHNLIDYLEEIINHARRFAQGDLSVYVMEKSPSDRLGKAFHVLNNSLIEIAEQANVIAQGEFSVGVTLRSNNDDLGKVLLNMLGVLRAANEENYKDTWLRTGQTKLNDIMRGEQDIRTLSNNIISFLAGYLDAQIGAVYLTADNNMLVMTGAYAFSIDDETPSMIKLGSGLTGEAALKKETIVTTNVPDDYIRISSGLGEAAPRHILITPLLHKGNVKGVIELGSFNEMTELQLDFITLVAENIAVNIDSAQTNARMKLLLEETQILAEQLKAQQEELQQTNEELEEHTQALKASEANLQAQQEELRQTNEELEEQARILEKQKNIIQEKNTELKKARQLVEQRAEDLELSSKYKSQFLANMSHELRTPLNSLLLLSKLLMENKSGNLTDKQVEFAGTIHSAGSDLLNLINDILDLSKIEAGKIEINPARITLNDFLGNIEREFRYIVHEKGLTIVTNKSSDLPVSIYTDRQRLDQVIKNLVSNAIKFTQQGSITIGVSRPGADVDLSTSGLMHSETIAISVSDSGVGIPEEKQKLIFEAFQQADGTTSRQYGGTGLGLSISRELAGLLGGEIHLKSSPGQGSTFTLYIKEKIKRSDAASGQSPLQENSIGIEKKNAVHTEKENTGTHTMPEKPFEIEDIRDDRRNIAPGDRTILIIEDDPKFSKILYDLALEKGFKGLIAGDGEAGLYLADFFTPSAIILDVNLPRVNGWSVMKQLRNNPKTSHIPVHFMSAYDGRSEAIKMGAIGYLTKPVSLDKLEGAFRTIEERIAATVKNLLIVEDNDTEKENIIKMINRGDIAISSVKTGPEAYEILQSGGVDCMILDLDLQDGSGIQLLERIRNDNGISHIPIIVYTGKELTEEEDARLGTYAESIVIKGTKPPQRLLDETILFLYRVESTLPEEKQRVIGMLREKETVLREKKILLVDDDMRNTFALMSILEEKGMNVLVAKNGREALQSLDDNPDIDLVLMDIMMPVMDGYEAMQEIRKKERYKKLPIITLTAKAMRDDRKKCIEAGASDYIAKPVDIDKLLSLLKVWLHK